MNAEQAEKRKLRLQKERDQTLQAYQRYTQRRDAEIAAADEAEKEATPPPPPRDINGDVDPTLKVKEVLLEQIGMPRGERLASENYRWDNTYWAKKPVPRYPWQKSEGEEFLPTDTYPSWDHRTRLTKEELKRREEHKARIPPLSEALRQAQDGNTRDWNPFMQKPKKEVKTNPRVDAWYAGEKAVPESGLTPVMAKMSVRAKLGKQYGFGKPQGKAGGGGLTGQ